MGCNIVKSWPTSLPDRYQPEMWQQQRRWWHNTPSHTASPSAPQWAQGLQWGLCPMYRLKHQGQMVWGPHWDQNQPGTLLWPPPRERNNINSRFLYTSSGIKKRLNCNKELHSEQIKPHIRPVLGVVSGFFIAPMHLLFTSLTVHWFCFQVLEKTANFLSVFRSSNNSPTTQ